MRNAANDQETIKILRILRNAALFFTQQYSFCEGQYYFGEYLRDNPKIPLDPQWQNIHKNLAGFSLLMLDFSLHHLTDTKLFFFIKMLDPWLANTHDTVKKILPLKNIVLFFMLHSIRNEFSYQSLLPLPLFFGMLPICSYLLNKISHTLYQEEKPLSAYTNTLHQLISLLICTSLFPWFLNTIATFFLFLSDLKNVHEEPKFLALPPIEPRHQP